MGGGGGMGGRGRGRRVPDPKADSSTVLILPAFGSAKHNDKNLPGTGHGNNIVQPKTDK